MNYEYFKQNNQYGDIAINNVTISDFYYEVKFKGLDYSTWPISTGTTRRYYTLIWYNSGGKSFILRFKPHTSNGLYIDLFYNGVSNSYLYQNVNPLSWHIIKVFVESEKLQFTLDDIAPGGTTGHSFESSDYSNLILFRSYHDGESNYDPREFDVSIEYFKLKTNTYIPTYTTENGNGIYDQQGNLLPMTTGSFNYFNLSNFDFRCIKQITIPEGRVKKIEDSNGNVIWGGLYRRLEYIKFTGNEYILTDHKPTNNRYYYLNFEIASKVNDRFIFAAGGDATSGGGMRCTVRTSASYFQRRYGRDSSSNGNIGTVCNINTQYQLRFRIFNDFQAYFAIVNTGGTVQGSSSVSAVTFTPANMNTFAIMGYGQGSYAGNLTAGRVYHYYYRVGDSTGDLGCNAYPVQRKSDGVCGLYDVITQKFYPMSGTTITDGAAGPVVDEYWDLTAPS